MSEQLNLNNWTCFHCGETFTTPGGARDHFGATPDDVAGCLIDRVAVEKGGEPERGRGLLMALRKSEAECAALRKERDERTEERDDWRYRAQLYGEHRDEYKAQAEAAEADVLRLQAHLIAIINSARYGFRGTAYRLALDEARRALDYHCSLCGAIYQSNEAKDHSVRGCKGVWQVAISAQLGAAEADALVAGLTDVAAGRVRSLADIRAGLKPAIPAPGGAPSPAPPAAEEPRK